MWKRSSVALCTIALTIMSIFLGAGTYAYTTGGSFTIDFSSPDTIKPVFSGLSPGDTIYVVIRVPNPIGASITSQMRLTNVICDENGVVEPEQEWYNLHGVRNDIDAVITFGLWIDRDGDTGGCDTAAGDEWVINEADGIHVKDIMGTPISLGAINPGKTITVVTSYHMDEETENWAQSDTMTFDIELTREEVPLIGGGSPSGWALYIYPPTAEAGVDQTAYVGDTVRFSGVGSFSSVGVVLVEYQWDFGDGATARGMDVTHVYTAPGVYTVTLTVEDSARKAASDTCTVEVLATPAKFTLTGLIITPVEVTVGSPAAISATLTNTGGSRGTYDATLTVNGTAVGTVRATLDPGASAAVNFTYTPVVKGTYMIAVDGLTGSLSAMAPIGPPIPVGYIAGVAVVVAASALSMLLYLRRKAAGMAGGSPSSNLHSALNLALPTMVPANMCSRTMRFT